MSQRKRPRVCGAQCHDARGSVCRCWCGGLFHGAGNDGERAQFLDTFGVEKVPTTLAAFRTLTGQPDLFSAGLSAGDDWRARLEAAVDARDTTKKASTHGTTDHDHHAQATTRTDRD